ncbi:MAG: DUF2868 domain-containing protein [Acidobacteriota bacterium]
MALKVRLQERDAQRVLMVRAFEEVDSEGHFLSREERLRASEEALAGRGAPAVSAEAAEVVARRAQILERELHRRSPLPRQVAHTLRLGSSAAWALLALALLLGLLASALGTDRHVHLLAVPLLATFAWNLFTYFSFASVWLLKGASGGPPGSGLGRIFAPLASFWAARQAASRLREAPREESSVVGPALARFLTAWRRAATSLLLARGRRLLHLAALLFMGGLIAGTYLRGLAFEYRATWESTFLNADQVERLFSILLTPASRLASLPIPPVAEIQAPASGPAAPWIHLFALTALLLVIIPRGLLALTETWRAWWLKRRITVELSGAYARRILAAGRGEGLTVDLVPVGHRPPAESSERLQSALRDLFGSQARLRLHPPLAAGSTLASLTKPKDSSPEAKTEEDEQSANLESPESAPWTLTTVLWFSLAATPEDEVHGEILREAQHSGSTLAVVDTSPYARQLGESGEERLKQRRKTWDNFAHQLEAPLAHLHLDQESADALHQQLSAALDSEPGSKLESRPGSHQTQEKSS